MTFDVAERSNYDGQPIALYEFSIGTHVWRYTSDEEKFTLPGSPDPLVFDPLAISDSGIVQSGDGQKNDVSITLPSNAPIAQLFTTTPPSEEIWVKIRRGHHGETIAPVIWVGTLSSSKQTGLRTTTLTNQMLTATFNRNGLRLGWGRGCPHALYDRNCRVNKTLWAVAMTVLSFDGNSIVSPSLALFENNYFSGGFFEFIMPPGIVERRAIERHAGENWFTILGTTEGISVGMSIMVYPGCNRTMNVCQNRFANIANYGGFPHLPAKSPFNGDPIF